MLIASIVLNVVLAVIVYIYRDLYKTYGSPEARRMFTEFDEGNGVVKMLNRQAEEYIRHHEIPAELVREQQLHAVDMLKRELCRLLKESNGATRVGEDGLYVTKDLSGKHVFSLTDDQIIAKFYSGPESLNNCKVAAAAEILQIHLGLKVGRVWDYEEKPY